MQLEGVEQYGDSYATAGAENGDGGALGRMPQQVTVAKRYDV